MLVKDRVCWVAQLGIGASILSSLLQCAHIAYFVLFLFELKKK